MKTSFFKKFTVVVSALVLLSACTPRVQAQEVRLEVIATPETASRDIFEVFEDLPFVERSGLDAPDLSIIKIQAYTQQEEHAIWKGIRWILAEGLTVVYTEDGTGFDVLEQYSDLDHLEWFTMTFPDLVNGLTSGGVIVSRQARWAPFE